MGKVASWNVPEELAALPDGEYKIGLRPHHLLLEEQGVKVNGTVRGAGIPTGSESIIRVKVNGNVWVSRTPGVHSFVYGEKIGIYFNSNNLIYFGADEKLI